jgi:prohibitin 2
MRNPFKKSDNKTPEGEPLERIGGLVPSSKKLVIIAAMVTFITIIFVISESVVIVQAGHRGVVLYIGAVENRVLGEGVHFVIPFAEQVMPLEVAG